MPPSTTPRPSRRTLLLVLGLAGLCAGLMVVPARSKAHPPRPYDRDRGDYRVTIEDERGWALPRFDHRGQTFVLGRFGDRYRVRIDNPTPHRVEAVVSVDGRDAISGARGDYRSQRGYVIAPYDSVVVSGFRRSLSEVATFRFTTPEDSYSGRMGTIENTGIIGVAIFPEASRPVPRPRPYESRRKGQTPTTRDWGEAESGRSAPRSESARGARPSPYVPGDAHDGSRLGTEYGESRSSPVVEVPFRRRNPTKPASVITVRYDDRRGLAARGIYVDEWERRWWPQPHPQAFPDTRFAPPPP